jgi:hypothetical protein
LDIVSVVMSLYVLVRLSDDIGFWVSGLGMPLEVSTYQYIKCLYTILHINSGDMSSFLTGKAISEILGRLISDDVN